MRVGRKGRKGRKGKRRKERKERKERKDMGNKKDEVRRGNRIINLFVLPP